MRCWRPTAPTARWGRAASAGGEAPCMAAAGAAAVVLHVVAGAVCGWPAWGEVLNGSQAPPGAAAHRLHAHMLLLVLSHASRLARPPALSRLSQREPNGTCLVVQPHPGCGARARLGAGLPPAACPGAAAAVLHGLLL
jgi:hypothetical protein